MICGQCGQPFEASACGFAHAEIAAERAQSPSLVCRIDELEAEIKRLQAKVEAELRGQAVTRVAAATMHEKLLARVEAALAEGRQALVGALLSELDAAQPDFAMLRAELEEEGLPGGLTVDRVAMIRRGWKALADHLRAWLESGAPERPLLNEAWARINALGGRGGRSEYSEAISAALDVIESLGGHDPAGNG